MSESERAPRPGPLYAGPNPQPPASRRKRSRARRASYALAAPVLHALLRGLARSSRLRFVEGREHLETELDAKHPLLFCCWHEQLVPATLVLVELLRERGAQLAFLVSPSVDGDLATRVVERAGGRVVRGSATRSGVKALRDLYRLMRAEGASPLFLCDGPQGPPFACKAGAPLLAELAGAPMLPVACGVRPALRLPTWDRLIVPAPFARTSFAVGAPIRVERAADVERARAELEAELRALSLRVGE